MGLQYEKNERKEYISTVIFSPFRRMIEHRHWSLKMASFNIAEYIGKSVIILLTSFQIIQVNIMLECSI